MLITESLISVNWLIQFSFCNQDAYFRSNDCSSCLIRAIHFLFKLKFWIRWPIELKSCRLRMMNQPGSRKFNELLKTMSVGLSVSRQWSMLYHSNWKQFDGLYRVLTMSGTFNHYNFVEIWPKKIKVMLESLIS